LNTYRHRQFVLSSAILFFLGGGCFMAAWYTEGVALAVLLMCCVGLLFTLFGVLFSYMTVQDEDDSLAVSFGPLRAFGTKIRYDEIGSVGRATMTLLDGIGAHTSLGGAWSFNPGTRDCVIVHLKNTSRAVRIGTDDAGPLFAYLERRIEGGKQ
jgi:hypothetical protein